MMGPDLKWLQLQFSAFLLHLSNIWLDAFFTFLCDDICCSSYQPPISSCDVLVVPVGHSSMTKAISVVQKLWSTGISADITYDVSQVSSLTGSTLESQSNLASCKQTRLWLHSVLLSKYHGQNSSIIFSSCSICRKPVLFTFKLACRQFSSSLHLLVFLAHYCQL